MDGRQSGCYASDPGPLAAARRRGGRVGFSTLDQVRSDRPLRVSQESPGLGRGRIAVAALAAALAPALAAIWGHPAFVTQDGPAHLYNAHILARSFDATSPFREAFQVRWEPLPNWAGHLTLMGLVSTLPPRVADRAMTTITLVAFAASVTWLRWRIAGKQGIGLAAILAAILSLNVAWLLGFASFMLGACLVPLTLGVWWSGRDEGWSWRRASGLAVLTVLGYFCHLVSLGLTSLGLAVLEASTPGGRRKGRATTTVVGLLPLIPLGAIYVALAREGGGIAPTWKHLTNVLSPRAWVDQLTWVDPISLARKDYLPGIGSSSPWFQAIAPVIWLGGALLFAIVISARSETPVSIERKGWWMLAVLLILGGVLAPDTLGASHGEYLQQRIVLLGLVALVPVLTLDSNAWHGRALEVMLVGALLIQSLVVWDYAWTSERTAGALLSAADAVGTRERVATLLNGIRTPFRSNPLMHADCGLGVDTGNIIWSDYETRFYYFPVQFHRDLDRPDAGELEEISLSDDQRDADERARRWERLLERHRDRIDVVLTWQVDPALDAVTERWFRVTYAKGPVRVYRRRLDTQ